MHLSKDPTITSAPGELSSDIFGQTETPDNFGSATTPDNFQRLAFQFLHFGGPCDDNFQ